MKIFCRGLLGLAMACAIPACQHHPPKEAKKTDAKPTPRATPKPMIADMNGDVSFQAFLGRLRVAVKQRDRAMLQGMMESDFGWRWDQPPTGETAFSYWDQHNLWPELDKLMAERFAPHDSYMVSPPAFVIDPQYRGYRCGVRQVNGNWRFAYFITGEDILP